MPDIPYQPQGIGYFHPDLNMSPWKAGKMLMKVAKAHAKGGKGKSKLSRGDRFMPRVAAGKTSGKMGGGKK